MSEDGFRWQEYDTSKNNDIDNNPKRFINLNPKQLWVRTEGSVDDKMK